jgi:Rrf2 family protein
MDGEGQPMRIAFSRRGDYAIRAMLALAEHQRPGENGYLSARRIAERMRIPARFVAHVLADLGRAGLVTAGAGRAGGYRLAAPAASISLLRVVDAADGNASVPRCVLRGSPCDLAGQCAVHGTIARTTSAARAELARTSLEELTHTGES